MTKVEKASLPRVGAFLEEAWRGFSKNVARVCLSEGLLLGVMLWGARELRTFMVGLLLFVTVLNIYSLTMHFRSYTTLKGDLQKVLATEHLVFCVLMGNLAPQEATHVLLKPLGHDGRIVTYSALQWWREGAALQAVGQGPLQELAFYRDTIEPWETDVFQGGLLVGLAKVQEELARLASVGVVEKVVESPNP